MRTERSGDDVIEALTRQSYEREKEMRAPTRTYLARLPARKRATLIMLFVVMFGGMVAGGSLT